jgi:hypothetical protein
MTLDREFLQKNGFLDDNTGKISLADKLEGKTKQYIMTQYRKKPVIIEAVQLRDLEIPNLMEIQQFVGLGKDVFEVESDGLIIKTLEGNMKASIGDFIIKGVEGEFYPCKPDIFEKTYEKVLD